MGEVSVHTSFRTSAVQSVSTPGCLASTSTCSQHRASHAFPREIFRSCSTSPALAGPGRRWPTTGRRLLADGIARSELAEEVERAMAPLTEREREVLRLRYGLGMGRELTLE